MERWVLIKSSKGKYEISDFGRCRNVKRGNILNENKSARGGRYSICGKREYTARLVATHFIENPLHFKTVKHIDDDLYNNVYNNLKWSQNTISRNIVGMFDSNGKLLRKFESVSQAGRFFNSNHSAISLCLNEKRPSAHGYYWKYI